MSLSQDGFAFEGITHHEGLVSVSDPVPVVVGQYMGVSGEEHLVGKPYGADVQMSAFMTGYESNTLLQAAIQRIRDKRGALTGALMITGNLAHTHPKMTFLNILTPEQEQYDGSGVNGWGQKIVLQWRRRT